MFLHLAVLKDGVHPVGVGHAVPVGLDAAHRDEARAAGGRFRHVGDVLLGVHQLRHAGDGLRGKLEVVGDLRLSGTSLLRGDEDDTVTGLGTVDGGRCGVFQYLHGLNVIGVYTGDVAQAHTVHDIERVGSHVGGVTAHADRGRLAGTAGRGDELHAGRLALQGLGGGGDGAVLHIGGFHLRDGARHRALLLHTVTDDDHFFQGLGVFLQGHIQGAALDHMFLRDVAHVGEHEGGSRLHVDGIVSVDVGDGTARGAFHLHTDADHGLAQVVDYLTCHFRRALGHGERNAHQ